MIAAGVLALASLACSPPEPTATLACNALSVGAGSTDTSVLLVVVDTLRRDALGAYGSTARTPATDALAREGLRFDAAYAAAPWTKPSVASLFTAALPSQHRVATHFEARELAGRRRPATDVLDARFETLAERYRAAGFDTAAFVANPWLAAGYGFEQGFERYDDSQAHWNSDAASLGALARRWLSTHRAEAPFFLYVHYLDPHRPYGPLDRERTLAAAEEIANDSRPVSATAARRIRRQATFADGSRAIDAGLAPTLRLLELAYLAGVERADRDIGDLVAAARALPGETAIIVTSDHGESFFEHGDVENHGTSLYESEVAVPLVMTLPHVSPARARVSCPIGGEDLLPFLCHYSGLTCPAPSPVRAGRDRLSRAGPPSAAQRGVLFEGVSGAPRHRGVRLDRDVLLWEPDATDGRPHYRLFDVVADPAQAHELLHAGDASQREAARARLPRLEAELEAYPTPKLRAPRGPRAPLAPGLAERLRALGYGE